MAIHNTRGHAGEWLAAQYLEERGYRILCANWRYKHWEIDLIASKDNILHIVEVKTRHSQAFGFPEEAVSKKKFNNLKLAAEHFTNRFPQWNRIQFNILAITRSVVKGDQYLLIEDVYI
jgi:putative endonuclease